jgi:hypothetical protein
MVNAWSFAVLFLFLTSLAGGPTATPAAKTHSHLGRLAGRVLGPNDAPVAGARVTMETADGRHPHATSTDRQGHFAFPDILVGTYEARAYWDSAWSEWQRNVIVRAGKTTEITLRISAKKPSTGFAARH